MKNEAAFTREFSKFVASKWKGPGFVFEAKHVKTGETLAISKFELHQLRSLRMSCSDTGLYHKISDESRVRKPFDGFFVRDMDAYIVCYFYAAGQFGMMKIQTFDRLLEENPNASSVSRSDFATEGLLYDAKSLEPVYSSI